MPSVAENSESEEERTGRPPSRSGHHSRSASEAGSHRTDHTTTITHVHVRGGNRNKQSNKQRKKQNAVHKQNAQKVPLDVLKEELKNREAKLKTTKEEQLQNNQQIDRLYKEELDKVLDAYGLKNAYHDFFRLFFQVKQSREDVFNSMEGKSEEDEKNFREYWRNAENEKLQEFLKAQHVAAAEGRNCQKIL
jgi:hypothetical protein